MRKRIFWISIAITVVGIVLITLICNDVYFNSSVKKTEAFLKVYAAQLDGAESFDQSYAVRFSSKLYGARVTFLDAGGNVLADSENQVLIGSAHISREEVMLAIGHGSGFSVRSSSSVGKNMAYYCEKLQSGNLLRISVEIKSAWSLLFEALPVLAWFVTVDIVLCLAFTYAATVFILKPVGNLAADAALYKKLETPYEELKPLADTMNRMNADIKSKMAELKKERDIVEKSQVSKDEFVANVTHEMNTPLTSIRGFSELIASGKLSAAQTVKSAKTITEQSERLGNLVACIINYSQIENDGLDDYDVNVSEIFKRIAETLRPSIDEKKISLTSSIQEGVVVRARTEYINEILGNLLRNAIKYNKEKNGCIDVTLRGGKTPSLTVSDTGIGIAPENTGRIFDRFFTVDKSHGGKNGGFGLGLAVVKKICSKKGWTLKVDSALGEGTVFTVEFVS